MSRAPELCLVMPAYNEQDCIENVVDGWCRVLLGLGIEFRMVVVNDGSKDGTGKLLDELAGKNERLSVVHQANAGHGPALVRAYREALQYEPKWVFHVDSDDQFEAEDFGLLWQQRTESYFIMGRRLHRHDPLVRLIITRILRLVNLFLFGCWLTDANIPFRLISAPYLRLLLQVIPPNAFAPNIFLAVVAARDGQPLLNIPVRHKARETGSISIVRLKLLKVCLRCAGELRAFRASLPARLKQLKEMKQAEHLS